MKAFTIYQKHEIDLRILLDKLKNYGQFNGDFEAFSAIYNEWHESFFPGCEVNTSTAIFRDDWFKSLVKYMANRDIF